MAATTEAPPAEQALKFPYRFEVLSLSRLIVDDAYQRPLTSFVDKIINKFDPALVGCLVVSGRQHGKYAVVDGQTRMEAMKELGMTECPCIVYTGLSQGEEASLFARLQKERRGIHSFHRFRAALVAGEREPLEIERITEDCGFTLGTDKDELSSVAALEYAYRRSPEILERTLLVFQEAWGDEKIIPTGDLIRGCAAFLADDKKNKIDDERLADRLANVTPESIRRRASALKEGTGYGGGGAVRHTRDAIANVYRTKPKT